jgi:hypothetical protein
MKTYLQKDCAQNIHSYNRFPSQKGGNKQKYLISWLMNKQYKVYLCNGMLFGTDKNEIIVFIHIETFMFCKRDQTQKITYYIHCMKCPEMEIYIEEEWYTGGGWEWVLKCTEVQGIVLGDKYSKTGIWQWL